MLKPSERFHKLRKLHKKNLIPTDQYEKEMPYVYEKAIERNFLLDKISPYYDIDSKLETVYGRYSNVLNYHSKEGKTLSLRIIKKEDEGLYEPEWQNMSHKNIVTILNRKQYEEEEAICYLSPYLQYSLNHVINSEAFKNSKHSPTFLPKWLRDIASGLEYLHSKEFAHTNITASNILIDDTLLAKITDFHFLNSTKKASNRIGLKYSNRPPESFLNSDGSSPVDCTKVDVWGLGILTVNIFTGMALEKKLPDDVSNWSKEVYPQIFKMLKKKEFIKLHRKYLKNASESDMLKSARSFAAFCFLFDPEERPTVKGLLRHDLLDKSGFLPKKDKVWHKKIHWHNIEKEISFLKGYEASYEDQDVVLDGKSSPFLENADNSNFMENTISLTNKVKLEFEGQNENIQKISQIIDTKENPPNCLSGDAEKNMLILGEEVSYEKEIITGTSQEDKFAANKSEGDHLADMLLSLSEFRIDSSCVEDKADVNLKKQQPNKLIENADSLENIENVRTSLEIEHEQDIDNFSLASKTEISSEQDLLADLLISLSEFQVHSANDEEKNIVIVDKNLKSQNENVLSEKSTTELQKEIKTKVEIQDSVKDTVTEEMQIFSPEIPQLKPEEKLTKNIFVTDFHKEKKAAKGRSYWNHKVGVYLLNFFIDNDSSNGMLHPENYLFKLVQKL